MLRHYCPACVPVSPPPARIASHHLAAPSSHQLSSDLLQGPVRPTVPASLCHAPSSYLVFRRYVGVLVPSAYHSARGHGGGDRAKPRRHKIHAEMISIV